MTQSLIIAQQCAIDTLETLEEEHDEVPLLGHTSSNSTISRETSAAQKRNSVWLNDLISEANMSISDRRLTWDGTSPSVSTARTPNQLLQKWTDQGEDIASGDEVSLKTPQISETRESFESPIENEIHTDSRNSPPTGQKTSQPGGIISDWTAEEVAAYIDSIGLGQYRVQFMGKVLQTIKDSLTNLSQRKTFLARP